MIFVYQNKTKYLLQCWFVYSSSPFPTTKAVYHRDDLYIPPQPKKGTQAFNNKKFRKTDAAQIQCSPCPNLTIPHQNDKLRKKCQHLDQLESSINIFIPSV